MVWFAKCCNCNWKTRLVLRFSYPVLIFTFPKSSELCFGCVQIYGADLDYKFRLFKKLDLGMLLWKYAFPCILEICEPKAFALPSNPAAASSEEGHSK